MKRIIIFLLLSCLFHHIIVANVHSLVLMISHHP